MAGILTVCTGNVCRSPFLEQLLRAELARALPAGHPITVASAGTRPPVGAPLDPRTARSLRAAGVEPTEHAARRLAPSDVLGARLVLTATREHRAAVVRAHPPALRYAFTAAEFERLCLLVDPGALGATGGGPESAQPGGRPWAAGPTEGETLDALVRAAAAGRGTRPPPRPEADDIADPGGAGDEVHLETVARLSSVVAVVVSRLAPVRPLSPRPSSAGIATGQLG